MSSVQKYAKLQLQSTQRLQFLNFTMINPDQSSTIFGLFKRRQVLWRSMATMIHADLIMIAGSSNISFFISVAIFRYRNWLGAINQICPLSSSGLTTAIRRNKVQSSAGVLKVDFVVRMKRVQRILKYRMRERRGVVTPRRALSDEITECLERMKMANEHQGVGCASAVFIRMSSHLHDDRNQRCLRSVVYNDFLNGTEGDCFL